MDEQGADPRWSLVGACRLVGAIRPLIDERKLVDYVLDPDHPVGKDKARVFARTLGYTWANYQVLLEQLRAGVVEGQPIPGLIDAYGTRFSVDVDVTGPTGRAIVRTGWIYRHGSGVPILTTLYVRQPL